MKALLALEDGFVLEGRSFTGPCDSGGEVIFNTGMTGYQEILTDPSYAGQMVCMTWPQYRHQSGRHGIRQGACGGAHCARVLQNALQLASHPFPARFFAGAGSARH